MSDKLFQLLAVLDEKGRLYEQEIWSFGFTNSDLSMFEHDRLISSHFDKQNKMFYLLESRGKEMLNEINDQRTKTARDKTDEEAHRIDDRRFSWKVGIVCALISGITGAIAGAVVSIILNR